jgi:hypothetical protein
MGMRLTGALALVLGTVAFAGPALAGNGNGNGNNGKPDSSTAAAASGSSAGAPGQLKKDQGASTEAPATTTATTTVSTTTTASSDQGVKPANDTAHDTHAAASSTKTKLYGNGQAAGRIATKNGASPSTVLHGPGNSQPHKAAPCSGGHEVDVHALKSRRHRGSCGSGPTPSPHPGNDRGHNDGSDRGSDPGSSPSGSSTTVMAPPATKSVTRPKARPSSSPSRGSGAALAAVQRPSGATLPFTGFPLWIGVAVGIVLLALGLALSLLAGRETEREVGP